MSPTQGPIKFVAPDLYKLTGDGIDVSYLPSGPGGKSYFTYQGPQGTLRFSGDQLRSVDVPDLGTVVSVTLVSTVDAGSTTFSVVVPHVDLPDHLGASVHMRTEGITTVHKFSIIPALNQGQREVYRVTSLHGTASNVIAPL
jgi:hypothetical protein